jgi:hypothetical protein
MNPSLVPTLSHAYGRMVLARLLLFTLACFAAPTLVAQQATDSRAEDAKPDVEDGFVPLFDGRLLSGWEGNGAWFRVEEGAIVAGTLEKKIPHNYFLCTTRSFGDFELRLQVKTAGEGANGGIQFRSRRIPSSEEVEGYQADVGGVAERSVWGGLYDESRRRKFLVEADAKVLGSLVKQDDWNDYRIRCVGPKIELYLNDVQTVDYTEMDDSIPQTGIIGVQIHSGPPAEVWYRNLRIKQL